MSWLTLNNRKRFKIQLEDEDGWFTVASFEDQEAGERDFAKRLKTPNSMFGFQNTGNHGLPLCNGRLFDSETKAVLASFTK